MMKENKITIFVFFLMTVLTVSFKTYFAYYVDLSLGVKGIVQNLILLMNPYSLVALLLSTLLFFKGRKAYWLVFTGGTLLTLLLYSNVVYFRFFSDFLTFSTLNQVSNVESMSGALWSSFQWYDFIYFVDTILYLVLLLVKKEWLSVQTFKRKFVPVLMGVSIALFFINLAFAEIDRPELLTRTFDHKYLVKYLGPYNFTVYDGVKTIQNNQQKAMASADDLTRLQSYTKTKYAEPNKQYFGIAKKKNIIKIHLESFQTVMIGQKVNGKEVTPFLNQLATGNKDFIYYNNFFHSTGQGKTSDAELTMDNSIYGLQQGSAFSLKSDNTFQSLPAILHEKQNYSTSVMHGDYKTFWNRDQIYKRFGIDKFYDATYYDMRDENLENLGLKDKEFFKESIPYLKKEKQPFYTHLITLTNHYPFTIAPEEATITSPDTGDKTVDGYVQTARYLDEAVRQFITDLKKEGLYDNSVIMIYGDHYGISENHNEAMGKLIGEEITPIKFMDLQRTGLFLKVPGVKGHVDSSYASQVDVMPTILHLTGIDAKPYTIFGTDLFSKKHNQMVVFRNGDFITPDVKSINGVFYSNQTDAPLTDEKMKAKATKIKNTVDTELEMSDSLLNGDLLRFYKNKDFKAIDPAKYEYPNGTVSAMK